MKTSIRRKVDLEGMVKSSPESAYEALQLYKSKVSRLRAKQDHAEALSECAKAAALMLKYGYESSGEELSHMFTDMLDTSHKCLTPNIRELMRLISAQYRPGSEAYANFLKDCLKWSVATGDRLYGDVLLQRELGECLWQVEGQRGAAVKHFVLGEAPEGLWMLVRAISLTA